MNTKLMQDQQVRRYFTFLLSLSFFMLFISMLFCRIVTHNAKFTAQGICEAVTARALTDTDVIFDEEKMRSGREILAKTGIRPALETQLLPPLEDFQKKTSARALTVVLPVCLVLPSASLLFLYQRDSLSDVLRRGQARDYASGAE